MTTTLRTRGFHHVTMVSNDAPRTLAFYGGLLGLGLVKKTVNFDDPSAYHLYFGDETGSPGTILTFFEWRNARRGAWGVGRGCVDKCCRGGATTWFQIVTC